jgi:hygromycin-B 4-O-kinase
VSEAVPAPAHAPVPAPAATDAARVLAFVRGRYGPSAGNVQAFDQGEWSKAFAFEQDGHTRVIRFSALDEDFAKDRFAGRWASPALPVPRVVELGPAFGGYYAVSEWHDGGFIDDLDEAGMRALLPALCSALDAARTADLSDTTGYGIWGADGNAPHASWQAYLLNVNKDGSHERIRGWRAALEQSAVGAAPFDEAYQTLHALVPFCPEDRHLIHSDLLHYNVLVADHRISGVLDWGCGLYGDFLYDIAWLTFWVPWFPAWDAIDFGQEAARHFAASGVPVPNYAERLRACELHIGLAGQAYQAYKGFWTDLEATAAHTLKLARASRAGQEA